MMERNINQKLEALKKKVEEKCYLCGLRNKEGEDNFVFDGGNPLAEVVLLLEAPGDSEVKRKEALIGDAWEELNKVFSLVGLSRDMFYITNICLCRPHNNRTPVDKEWEACRPRLDLQLKIIAPKLIVAMGTPAGKAIIKPDYKVSQDRGQLYKYNDFDVFGTFHPAYFLHKKGELNGILKGSAEWHKKKDSLRHDMKCFLNDMKFVYNFIMKGKEKEDSGQTEN
jgi:uracil-DNA glycosylase family 4